MSTDLWDEEYMTIMLSFHTDDDGLDWMDCDQNSRGQVDSKHVFTKLRVVDL